jgi:hypothetical protein
VVGVAGALIASAVGIGGFFSLGTWLIAVGGALLLLVIYNTLANGRRSARSRRGQLLQRRACSDGTAF